MQKQKEQAQAQANPFSDMEKEVLNFWEKNKIFEKSVDTPPSPPLSKGREIKDYVFYDGPPFATGTPHYGHIVGSIMKDAVPRYWTMQGYKVERKWGWDCHGLPIENIVEKELGSKAKKDIEAMGVEKFNELCRSKVLGYVDEWEAVIRRLGRWADMKNAYKTMDLNYMESIWWVFKELYDQGLVYEGYRSMHICPRCETTLSQQEVSEGYKDIKDLSCIAKFELEETPQPPLNKGGEGEKPPFHKGPTCPVGGGEGDFNGKTYILAWTTTPWTLIGNVALAVGKDIDYVKVKVKDDFYIIAKDIYENLYNRDSKDSLRLAFDLEYADNKKEGEKSSKIENPIKEFKGKDLIGKKYKPLFDYYLNKNEELLNSEGDGNNIACLVVVKENKVLMGLREYSKDKKQSDFKGSEIKDFWIVPGGRSEAGESFANTIARELKEEVNIEKYSLKKYLGGIDGYLDGDAVKWYLIDVEDFEQIKNNEPEKFKEWKFLSVDEIPKDDIMRTSDLDYFNEAIEWNNVYKIYAADFVTTEDGTGVVHIAPAFGEDDMNLGKQENLPFIQHVGMDGNIKPEVKDFAGLNVKPVGDHMSTDIEIIKYLAHHNLLFDKKKYEHSYPHCWRCDTPLINYATSSWFVGITKIKDKLLETAKEINWSPEHIKEGRFGKWLEGARDWSISRQRFWASVMPIWVCDKCGEKKVLGSVKELENLSGEKVTDLHKHIVDKITFPCKCGGTMKRVPDVLDTWFDSGSMPYAQMHYPFENKEKFENNFPAEFIAEGVDQTRAWFYYMHSIAGGIKGKRAFNNVIVNGIVLAEDGKKMAKKLQNYPDPNFVFDKYGADALRYYLLTSPVMIAENLNFSEKGVQESLRNVIMTLWNVFKFYEMYAEPSEYTNHQDNYIKEVLSINSSNILDKWILAKLNQLVREVTDNMNNYNLPKAARPIEDFINNLSTWYLRRSRDRFKNNPLDKGGEGDFNDKQAALNTTRFVLLELAKVMAPFMPFVAENLWQKVTGNNFQDGNKSIHLESWSSMSNVYPTFIEMSEGKPKDVFEEMEKARKLTEQILSARDERQFKIRQPLGEAIISIKLGDEYKKIVEDECNIKKITEGNISELPTSGIWRKYGDALAVNFEITPELKLEGSKRELVRLINALRKQAGMTIQDRAVIYHKTYSKEIKDAFIKMGKEIMSDTLSDEIIDSIDGADLKKEVKVNGEEVILGIKKK